jgi:GMP synthase-like glutamine amidotransferase
MRIHYFQHDHFEDMGYIGQWAAIHDFKTSVTRLDLNEELPQEKDFEWLVVMGGKMSVNDSDEFPWIDEEIEFIRQTIHSGKVVIGICLGSQLVASALGARVYKNIEPEMGFWPVTLLPAAAKDKVFRHFPSSLSVMHVHFDIFGLPENATAMALSEVTPFQAFRYGENVFAFQFHFEISPQNANGFIKEISPELVQGEYTQTAEQMIKQSVCCYENNIIFGKVLNEIFSLTQKPL